jgi:hypothetical protein
MLRYCCFRGKTSKSTQIPSSSAASQASYSKFSVRILTISGSSQSLVRVCACVCVCVVRVSVGVSVGVGVRVGVGVGGCGCGCESGCGCGWCGCVFCGVSVTEGKGRVFFSCSHVGFVDSLLRDGCTELLDLRKRQLHSENLGLTAVRPRFSGKISKFEGSTSEV